MSTAEGDIAEAQSIMRKLVEFERGRCGGSVERAKYHATIYWGVEEGTVNTLWKRRFIKSIASHIMAHLRQIDAVLKENANIQRRALNETAESLERRGSPAARLARAAAQMAGAESE